MTRCWAYNQAGVRCELEAGHEKDHSVIKTWTDDECYSPIKMQAPPAQPPVKPNGGMPEPAKPNVNEITACVACSHKHVGGACKCGCYSHI